MKKSFIKDQLGRVIELSQKPIRVVSLVPSQTELLVDLGLEDYIVGLTKFCVYPKELRKAKTIVGGTKEVNYNKISELQPDIILCNKEENTRDIVETLEKKYKVHVSDVKSMQEALELIIQYGIIFNAEEKAGNIVLNIKESIIDFRDFIKGKSQKKVAYFIWRDPWMTVGGDTFINSLLELNNFENVFKKENRYPVVNLENLDKSIDLVLLSSEPFPFKKKHTVEFEVKVNFSVEVKLVDGEYFSWYGSRLQNAFEYFKSIH